MSRTQELHHLTWKEIEGVFAQDPVVLIPLGSMEEHGPHSPTGDYLAAEEITKKICAKTGAYSVPVIPFGYSEHFRGFPGTISFSPQTFTGVITDIVRSLVEHGISRIIFINGHFGNAPYVLQVARAMRREYGIMIGAVDLWQCLTPAFKKELYGADFDPSGHGAEPVTSVMMHLYPDDMRFDLLPAEKDKRSEWEGFAIGGLTKVKVADGDASIYFNMEDLSASGVLGNPRAASSERGQAIFNKIVDYGAAFVEKMKTAKVTGPLA